MSPQELPLEARQAAWDLLWRRLLRDPEAQDPDAVPSAGAAPAPASTQAMEGPYGSPDIRPTEINEELVT